MIVYLATGLMFKTQKDAKIYFGNHKYRRLVREKKIYFTNYKKPVANDRKEDILQKDYRKDCR